MTDSQPNDFAEAADEAALLRKVRCKCRRGMRELDRIMERYLSDRWPQASAAERDQFLSLLDVEDDKLFQWFMGYEPCTDERYSDIVRLVGGLPPDSAS